MKKIFKLIIALLCVCMVISSSACGKTKTLGEITSKLIAGRYKVDFYKIQNFGDRNQDFIPNATYKDFVINFEDEVIMITADKQLSSSNRKLLIMSFSNQSDFNLAIDERELIVKIYFGVNSVYMAKDNIIIFGNDSNALADIGDVAFDKDLSKVINNLISNGYGLSYNQNTGNGYNILEAKKSVNILGAVKTKSVITYIFNDESKLDNYYDECKDFYQKEIERGDLILEKKGKLLIVTDSEYTIKDALGK